MSVSVYQSLPRVNFRGVQDESTVNLAMPVESLGIRLPLFFTLAPWGDEAAARYVDASGAKLLYGDEILNPKSAFFTHQNVFLRSNFTGGAKALVQRVVPEDAKQGSGRLALDMVADELPVYERNPDGSFKLDALGAKIDTGTKVDGYRLQWRMVEIPTAEDSAFGVGDASDGTMVSVKDGTVSTLTPIMDMLARFRGAKNVGFRLIAPTAGSNEPADVDQNERLGTFLYRFQEVQRSSANSTSTLKRTLMGESYVPFSFKEGVVDLTTNVLYSAGDVINQAYESTDPTAFTGYGNFERMHFYTAGMEAILATLAAAEAVASGEAVQEAHLLNILTGVDANGIPYNSFVVEGPSKGGLMFGELTNHYLLGGSDGTLGTASYNTLINDMLDGLEESEIPYASIARMPFDSVWDSGFPMATKLKFAKFHGLRPDVFIHVCTQDVSQPINTPSQDSSIGITLRSTFRAMQESSEFGTKALRFAVFSCAGYLINDDYTGLVPFLEWMCLKGAEYMGAENGEMNSTYAFGRGEQNVVTRYRTHNAGTKPENAKNADWNNGVNFPEWYDMSRLFYAGIQSIYENHTSILHSYFNTQIACNLTRIGHVVWREMSGDDQLTDDEFLDAVNARVVAKTTGRYDGRVDITSNAYYNALDEALSFSWHLNIGMAGENIRTVENLAIISQRRRNEVSA